MAKSRLKIQGTIREQLLQQGFKESPLLLVERLFQQHQELMKKPIWNAKFRARHEKRVQELQEKIVAICTERGIGNPFKGEKIEWKRIDRSKQK